MKIGIIGHKRIPSREGGIEIVVEQLAVRLAALGHQVEVYNRKERFGKKNRQCKEYKGVRIIQIPTFRNETLNAFVYLVLATFRAVFCHYDVIHFHATGPSEMLWLPHLLGIHTVSTIHGLDWQRAKWGSFATNYLLHAEKTAVKYADEIIILSRNIQKYFQETYHREVHYIPNGIEIPEKKEVNLIQEKYGLEKDGYLLFLARLVPEKGLHYLLEAYRNIDCDKRLVIAGDDSHHSEYIEELRKLAQKDERVLFTGHVEGRILEELFSNCFLYILPSDVEGMAISLLEAISYQAVCLVSDIPENLEVTGDAMPSFRKGDVNSLQEVLQKLLQGEREKYLGPETRKYCDDLLARFQWDTIVSQTLELYNRRKARESTVGE